MAAATAGGGYHTMFSCPDVLSVLTVASCARRASTDRMGVPCTWFCARRLADSGIINSFEWPSLQAGERV